LTIGQAARAKHEPLAFLLDGQRQFGDVFRYQFGPLVFHQLAHPDHIKQILVDRQKDYPRSWYYGRIRPIVGEGLVTTEGADWRRLRRMVQPSFHQERIRVLAGVMTDATEAMCARWTRHAQDLQPIVATDEFLALTLRIVGLALLSIDFGDETNRLGQAITTSIAYGEYRLMTLHALPPFVPTPRNIRYKRAMKTIERIIYDMIASRRREPDRDRGDLLAALLAARDETTGEGLSDKELRDQLFTFIAAGHETTAVALAWTFYLLSQHPDAEVRLHDEVATVLGGRTPTVTDLPQLAFTRRVIEESLRIYPPVYTLIRDATHDDEIGGYHIPARSMVVLCPYVTHRHPEFWPDPETFDPDRFLPERTASRPRFAWYPFLGGPHQCIGQEFAMMETTLVVAMIAQRFRLRMAPGSSGAVKPTLSLRPRDGLVMTIHAAD
jgi:cytochrome P450